MVGKNKRAIALLRKTNLLSDFKAYHFLLHQQPLCAKHVAVKDVMTTVGKDCKLYSCTATSPS